MPERIARVRLPDGRIARVKVPEGTTPEQALEYARSAAEQQDKKPTSFWQGVGEGAVRIARRGSDVLDSINPVQHVANAAMGALGIDTDKQTKTLRQANDAAYARRPTRGSTAGKMTGEIIASLPTMFLPGGPVVQGAAGGALLGNSRDAKGVVTDAVIGGVTGKVADKALRALSPVARKGGEAISTVAQRLGIRPTPASMGGSTAGAVQTGLGIIPGAGGAVGQGVSREIDDLGAAAARTARQMGTVSTPQGAGEAMARGASKFRTDTKTAGKALYKARNTLMGGDDAPVLLGSAAQNVRQFADDFPNLNGIVDHPAVRKLAGALPDGPEPELTLREATEALSHIRGAARNAERSNTMTDPIKARVGAMVKAIEDDVLRAAQASDAIAGRTGTATAQSAQRTADRFWAIKRATERGPLKSALASYDDDVATSGESVYKAVLGDMNRTGGNLKRLRRTWGAMPQDARSTFAATAFEELGKAKPGASSIVPESIKAAVGIVDDVAEGSGWSFNTFHTNYQAMSPEARRLVFGGRGVDQQIDDIARYSARLKELDRLRNFSNTARGTVAAAYVGIVGNEMLNGDLEGAGKTAIAIPAAALAGKAFMATPAGRLWLRNSLRTLTEKGGTQTGEAALRKLTRQLPVIAESNPVIREEALGLFRTLNQSAPVPVLAGEKPENGQGQ